MKPYHSLIVFVFFLCCAALSSTRGYIRAENDIIADMNQALAKTLARKQEGWITPDTITNYRSHLRIEDLRRSSIVCYAQNHQCSGLWSHKIEWHQKDGQKLTFQGYANCTVASVFALSDQRLPFSLTLLAMLWAALSCIYFHKRGRTRMIIGGMMIDEGNQRFLTLKNEEISFTPMQQQLMIMFVHADGHRLAKQDICDTLWPGKPDASDTLYTLIRRIRQVIAALNLTITTERGKDYRLIRKD